MKSINAWSLSRALVVILCKTLGGFEKWQIASVQIKITDQLLDDWQIWKTVFWTFNWTTHHFFLHNIWAWRLRKNISRKSVFSSADPILQNFYFGFACDDFIYLSVIIPLIETCRDNSLIKLTSWEAEIWLKIKISWA